MIAFINSFNSIAFTMCYLIVLGKILASWTVDIFEVKDTSVFAHKNVYIVGVCLVQTYWFFKKHLNKLKIIS